jgi:hypothetical protein
MYAAAGSSFIATEPTGNGCEDFSACMYVRFLSSTTLAQVYKWIDERGVTHYGDKPPAHHSTTQISIPKEPPASERNPANARARCSSDDCGKSNRSDAQSNPPSRARQTTGISSSDQPTTAELTPIQKAIADCKANRGADCNKPDEIDRWVRQNTPLTPGELAARNERPEHAPPLPRAYGWSGSRPGATERALPARNSASFHHPDHRRKAASRPYRKPSYAALTCTILSTARGSNPAAIGRGRSPLIFAATKPETFTVQRAASIKSASGKDLRGTR